MVLIELTTQDFHYVFNNFHSAILCVKGVFCEVSYLKNIWCIMAVEKYFFMFIMC